MGQVITGTLYFKSGRERRVNLLLADAEALLTAFYGREVAFCAKLPDLDCNYEGRFPLRSFRRVGERMELHHVEHIQLAEVEALDLPPWPFTESAADRLIRAGDRVVIKDRSLAAFGSEAVVGEIDAAGGACYVTISDQLGFEILLADVERVAE